VDELPKDVEMHFYGTGAMERPLKEKGIPNVYFHGPYFRSQQEEILGAAHVSVVTLSDGMYGLGVPSKTYNIMAAGRPIIYFGPENGEIGLLIKEHGIGYIGWPKKWDVEDLKSMGAKARNLFLSISKSIVAARRVFNRGYRSSHSFMYFTKFFFALRFLRTVSQLFPNALTIPPPVTTTRLFSIKGILS